VKKLLSLLLLLISSTLLSFSTLAQIKVPKTDPLIDSSWITDQSTFNYRLPCEMGKINAVVIIIHGTNRLDLVTTNNKQRKLLYDEDVSSTYPIMDKFCVITVIPKSEIVTGRDSEGVTRLYRSWWMSDKVASYRDEQPEIDAVLSIIQLAKEVVNKPIFLAAGHDRGITRAKLIALMLQEKSQTINKISGFIDIEYRTAGSRYFCESLFWASLPKQAAKT
jgi:hypothetical protein